MVLFFFTDIFVVDILNQLLDFYDEIERQNAVLAQAVVETSEQQSACSSSVRADAAPMATMPEHKVERCSAFFSISPSRRMPLGFVFAYVLYGNILRFFLVDYIECRNSSLLWL